LSSSDPQANLPGPHPFTAADQGTYTFTNVTLTTAATQSLTATDTGNGSLTATQAGIVVTPAPAVQFLVSAPATAVSGAAFDVTVTAVDPYGNTDTNYAGTVSFSSSDTDPGVVLPPDYSFTSADAGMVTFPGGVTLITLGDQSLTVSDTSSGITGSATVTVTSGAGPNVSGNGFGKAPTLASSLPDTADHSLAADMGGTMALGTAVANTRGSDGPHRSGVALRTVAALDQLFGAGVDPLTSSRDDLAWLHG
jgi:hypothetical protein